jgi:single-strand DNA-binding protein
MAKFLKKGSLVGITGRISVRSKNENGKYETTVNINADRVEFLESKASTTNSRSANQGGSKVETPVVEEPKAEEKNEDLTDLDDSIL